MNNAFDQFDGMDLSALGNEADRLDKLVKEQEDTLSNTKQLLEHLKTVRLPRMLTDMGLSSARLASGRGIAIDKKLFVSCLAGDKPALIDWLKENGEGGIVKEEVNPQTLKSWAKDRIENMQEVPEVVRITTAEHVKFTR